MKMKFPPVFVVLIIFSTELKAAVSSVKEYDSYLMPSDSMTVLRGDLSFCRAEKPQKGSRSFSYLQFGKGRCTGPVSTSRVGKDRPESEAVDPGIPFEGKGL
ncbi:MAG: hypothetical protein ACXVCY_05225 [Pseudobdellovibrionaceae bacterium]